VNGKKESNFNFIGHDVKPLHTHFLTLYSLNFCFRNSAIQIHQTKEALEWRFLHLRTAKLKGAKGASYILAAFSMVSTLAR
jgi:hypothetical protein